MKVNNLIIGRNIKDNHLYETLENCLSDISYNIIHNGDGLSNFYHKCDSNCLDIDSSESDSDKEIYHSFSYSLEEDLKVTISGIIS